jgi:hypothetical protein
MMSPPVRQLRNAVFCDGSGVPVKGRSLIRALFWMTLVALTAAGLLAWRSLDTFISLPIL